MGLLTEVVLCTLFGGITAAVGFADAVSLWATALKFPELCVRVSGFPGLGYGLAAC